MGWPAAALALALLLPRPPTRHLAPRQAARQSARRLFQACMDRQRIAALGNAPLRPELLRLAAISGPRRLAAAVAGLHRYGIFVLFTYAPPPLHRQPLPPGALRRHMQRDFMLAGDAPAPAARESAEALALTLALAPPARSAPGDPVRPLYLPLAPAALLRLAPAFDWAAYAAARPPLPPGARPGDPAHLRLLGRLLRRTPAAAWRSYLRWRWIHATAAWLSPPFVTEEFLYDKLLNHIAGGQPGRGALCEAEGAQFSAHDYRTAPARAGDFFGDMLRLSAARASHELW